MKNFLNFTAIIEKEEDGYVSLCGEIDAASQDAAVEEERNNLQDAIELFLEHASKDEIASRLKNDFFYNECANRCWVN